MNYEKDESITQTSITNIIPQDSQTTFSVDIMLGDNTEPLSVEGKLAISK